MQRLARLSAENFSEQTERLFQHYDELIRIIRRNLPPSTANLFSRPVRRNDWIEWYTDLQGQPIPVDQSLSDETRQEIQHKIEQYLERLTLLLNHSDNGFTQEQYSQLKQLIDFAKSEQCTIYHINNEPVLVGWGKTLEKTEIPPTPTPIKPKRKCHWCCFVCALFLLLLLAVIVWLYFLYLPQSTVEPQKESPLPKDKIIERLEQAGGTINGDFRATLSWHNANDLDLELNTLTAQNCRNKYAFLDLDMNGASACNSERKFDDKNPIENLVVKDKKKMPDGVYTFFVEQFGAHQMQGGHLCQIVPENAGFELQLQFNNEIKTFTYSKLIDASLCLKPQKMLEVEKQGEQFKLIYVNPGLNLTSTQSSKPILQENLVNDEKEISSNWWNKIIFWLKNKL